MSTKNYEKAREIAAEALMLLLDRKGFDDLWHDFGPTNRAEILDAIVETAEKIMDGGHATKNWKKRTREFYEDYTEDVREAVTPKRGTSLDADEIADMRRREERE